MTEGVLRPHDDLAARARRRRRLKAVVLAGGKGTRLAPYTSVLPKPLMPIGDRSILELVLGQFAACRHHRRHPLRRAPLAPDPGRAREPPRRRRRDQLRARGGTPRHRGAATACRRARPDLHRDERRRPDDAPLRRLHPPSPTQPQRRHDRDARAARSRSTTASSPRREWPAESGRRPTTRSRR